jgi:hypothetical protein
MTNTLCHCVKRVANVGCPPRRTLSLCISNANIFWQQQARDQEVSHHQSNVRHCCHPRAASLLSYPGVSNRRTERQATIGSTSVIVVVFGKHHRRQTQATATAGPRGMPPSAPCPSSSSSLGSITAIRLGQQQARNQEAGHHRLHIRRQQAASPPSDLDNTERRAERPATIGSTSLIFIIVVAPASEGWPTMLRHRRPPRR